MMFKDVGKEIKELAENHAWSKALAYGFITFVIALAAGSAWAGGVAPIIVPALLIAVVGGVVGYRKGRSEAMLIYSWGELVDRVTSLERKLSGDCDRKIVIVKRKRFLRMGTFSPWMKRMKRMKRIKRRNPRKALVNLLQPVYLTEDGNAHIVGVSILLMQKAAQSPLVVVSPVLSKTRPPYCHFEENLQNRIIKLPPDVGSSPHQEVLLCAFIPHQPALPWI